MDSARYDLEFRDAQPLLGGLRPVFSPAAAISTHRFRGHVWFVAQDPVSLQYFRFGPTERRVVALLDGALSLREIHQQLQEDLAADAPSFQDILAFVQMLRSANLLQSPDGEKLEALTKRVDRKRAQRTKSVFANFLFIQIPLFDPDRFLRRTVAYVRFLFTRAFLAVWLAVVLVGLGLFVYHIRDLARPAEGILAPDNLVALWATFVALKLVHELAHAYLARHYGSEVHRMGIIFLVFTPCAFVDVTGLWGVESKHRRALVGAAGMMAELFIATFALLAWLATEPGLLHALAYNVIFIASVSSLLFNGNPLLRFDAYYILSDAAELPNLWTNSRRYIHHLGKRYLLGLDDEPPTRDRGEKRWFVVYGVASLAYRTVVVVGIILFVASVFFGLGVVLAVAAAVMWVLVPFGKLVHYLLLAKATRGHRPRCLAVFAVAVAAIVAPLALADFPQYAYAPCALLPQEQAVVRARWRGFVADVWVRDGEQIAEGALVATCRNAELDREVVRSRKELEIAGIRLAGFEERNDVPAAQAERVQIQALTQKLAVLRQRVASLRLAAPCGGRVVAPGLGDAPGRFLSPGAPLAVIARGPYNRIVVVMDQANIAGVQRARGNAVSVRFRSDPGQARRCRITKIVPQATHEVPSPSLTGAAGGPVVLDPSSPEAPRTLLPWFRVELALPGDAPPVPLGATGKARFLIAHVPLAHQWYYKILRLLRTRFLL